MKTLIITISLLTFALTANAQKYSYSAQLNGVYTASKCYHSLGNEKETVAIAAASSDDYLFSLINTSCSGLKLNWIADGNFFKEDYVLKFEEAAPSNYAYFRESEGRIELVIWGYEGETIFEHFYIKNDPVNISQLTELAPQNQMMSEEEYDEMEKKVPGKELLPEVLANYDWFNNFEGMCFENPDFGKLLRVVKTNEYVMGVEYADFGNGEEIICYFYVDFETEKIEQWRNTLREGVVRFHDRFELNEDVTSIYFNRLAYNLSDCM
jgi:hypothetical protein